MISSTINECSKHTDANWPMAVITFFIVLGAIVIFAIYRFTDNERLKIKMLDEIDFSKRVGE